MGFLNKHISEIDWELTHKFFIFFIGIWWRGIVNLLLDFIVKRHWNFSFLTKAIKSKHFLLDNGIGLLIGLNKWNKITYHIRANEDP